MTKTVSSQPVPLILELRINTNISMELIRFSVKVSSVKIWGYVSSLLILQDILCLEF